MDRRLVLSCLLGLFGSDEFERMTTPSVKVVLLLSLCSVVTLSFLHSNVFLTFAQKICLHSTKLPFRICGTVHTKEVIILVTIYGHHTGDHIWSSLCQVHVVLLLSRHKFEVLNYILKCIPTLTRNLPPQPPGLPII